MPPLPARSRSTRPRPAAPAAAQAGTARPRACSYRFREIAGRPALLFRNLVCRAAVPQNRDELVEDGNKKNGCAKHKAHLGYPDRYLDKALSKLAEPPALVDEARHRPYHVADKQGRDGEREDLGPP